MSRGAVSTQRAVHALAKTHRRWWTTSASCISRPKHAPGDLARGDGVLVELAAKDRNSGLSGCGAFEDDLSGVTRSGEAVVIEMETEGFAEICGCGIL